MAGFSFKDLVEQVGEVNADTQMGGGDFPPDVDAAPGEYLAEIVYAAYKQSAKGKDGMSIKFKVTEVIKGSGPVGATSWKNEYVSPESDGAMKSFFRTMAVYGFPQSWFLPWDEDVQGALEAIAAALPGTVVNIKVKEQAGYKPSVDWVNRPKGAPAPVRDSAGPKAGAPAGRPVVKRRTVTPPGAAI